MKLPSEFEDQYVKDVLYNRSLENLPDEKWEPIEGYESYKISNYGRVKSLARETLSLFGKERTLPEMIMKPGFVKHFNKYLNKYFYNINCRLSRDGKKTSKPVSRLVYYHFVEEFDFYDQRIHIEAKDGNRLHVHSSNLKKNSASERSLKTFRMDKAKNRHVFYQQTVSQYTTEGELVANFDSFYAAEKAFGIDATAIYHATTKQTLVAGAYRWFLQSNPPKKEDFIVSDKSGKWFNEELWIRLGKPLIDKKSPPSCMNLSIEDLPNEKWKPIPGFKGRFSISNKGRIKRWGSWNPVGRKFFQKDSIVPQFVEFKGDTIYSMCVVLDDLYDKKKKSRIEIARFLFHCFVKAIDLNDKTLIVLNENNPQWELDLSKLVLRSVKDIPKGKKLKSIRILLNSKKTFNDVLWEKLGKPDVKKKNPPPILNLSLSDLPNEHWKPLPGYEGKYVISNKGRVKRLSGWKMGIQFFAEEQILTINTDKFKDSLYLCFRLHEQIRRRSMRLHRLLYHCFVEEFDLNDTSMVVVNDNIPLWEMDLSKLSLHDSNSRLNQKRLIAQNKSGNK
ncbi:NUMOD4 motif-containing protein [Chryseobacterium wanjuense]|uniref:NUMOD4 motif-containing protein n=1 Tax=Chryseobacterium wanjuense TaxID=356305 RepID=A0A1I0QBB3_9FLAO|nr:NUMOD4 domain-containing protein [Chryseobacterium wanjuense]SEW24334.1 NUMOD4 motif-containing protein [Chryseobacterium wanjuense]